jgi:hypothetical protein
MNRIHPFSQNDGVVIGTPVADLSLYLWSKRVLRWALVPLEIPSAAIHLSLCMGCFGTFGNPITPIIENVPYDELYGDRIEKMFSFFTSSVIGVVHGLSAIFTCCGCCGVLCSPSNGLTFVTESRS